MPWEHMLGETFGNDFSELVAVSTHQCAGVEHLSLSQLPSSTVAKAQSIAIPTAFAKFIACGTLGLIKTTSIGHLHKGHSAFVSWLLNRMNELKPVSSTMLREVAKLDDTEEDLEHLYGKYYWSTANELIRLCQCKCCTVSESTPNISNHVQKHLGSGCSQQSATSETVDRSFCLLGVAETILRLSCLLSTLVLDTPLKPTHSGLIHIYDTAHQ